MGRLLEVIAFLVFCNLVYTMPVWDNEEEADFSPSSVEIIHRRCSCSDHHQKCGCCLQIRAPAFQNYEEADVCMNSSFTTSPLAVDFLMTWNKREVLNRTISDSRPQPVCFDIPLPNYGKACVKFTKNTIKKDHIRWCAALEFESKHNGRDIPLGCFFFRGEDGHGVEMGTFLDPVSFISLLEDVFQASKKNQIDSTSSLTGPALETWNGDKNGCQCSKFPPECECSLRIQIFGIKLEASVSASMDPDGGGFDLKMVVNGHIIFDQKISVKNPPPICHDVTVFDVTLNACIKLTDVSLKPDHMGACLEVDVDSYTFHLGCFYMATYRDLRIILVE
nr:uncharacterized protein LOC131777491 [Pocillopora verrucosa]